MPSFTFNGEDSITINDCKIDIGVLLAVIDTDKRYLWQFVKKDGIVQAVPYSEEQIIWIDRKEI